MTPLTESKMQSNGKSLLTTHCSTNEGDENMEIASLSQMLTIKDLYTIWGRVTYTQAHMG